LWGLGDLVVDVFKIENVVQYLPLYIFFFSILNILNSWYVRIRRFRMKAYSKIVENAGYILIAVMIYVLVGQNEFGLAAGKMSGILIALIVLAAVSKLNIKWRPGAYASLLRKHREFPLHYMPSSFVNTLGLQMLVLFIGAYYQKEDLGYFGLANMVIIMPISVMTQSVGTIFFQKTSESVNKGQFKDVKSLFFQTGGLLALVAVPAFLILFFGSPYLFPVIFGSNWYITGIIAKFLSLVFLAQIIVGPLSIVLISLKRIRLNALWQYGRFGIMLIYLLFLVHIKELAFIEFIEWYSYGAAIMYACYLLIIYYVVRVSGNANGLDK
jgi:O-antigen/teichoic acid export membrane protein